MGPDRDRGIGQLPLEFHVVSIFPEIFQSFLATSLIGKAIQTGLIRVALIDPRQFARDKHRTVDDVPFGGGEGMVLKCEPIVAAIESVGPFGAGERPYRVLLSPQGQRLDQGLLRQLAARPQIVLVCGRYEGLDERISAFVDAEVSLGDYVLNGGEVAAMAVIDGVARLIPGVIGNQASLEAESHEEGLLNYPQYTRPREFRGLPVPDELLSGDHARIKRWRRVQMLRRTRERRPDMWARFEPGLDDGALMTSLDEGEPDGAQPSEPLSSRTYVALIHHPVYDREHKVVTTALTNLDLHDLARSARTYGLSGYFVVTPIVSQQELASRILEHWRGGHGAHYHRERADALGIVAIASSLREVTEHIAAARGLAPVVIATSARRRENTLDEDEVRRLCGPHRPLLLVFGTGWGLTEEVLAGSRGVLPPLKGPSDYNHLSVRSAAAITLDRLFGMRDEQ